MTLATKFLLFLLYTGQLEAKDDDDHQLSLSNCSFVDPDKNIRAWIMHNAIRATCDPTTQEYSLTSESEYSKYLFGNVQFAFDIVTSDKIGPFRDVPDARHSLCKQQLYNITELENYPVSIVIIYHNEALSVLIRMLNGILERTPASLLREIVLLDDFSDESPGQLAQKLLYYGRLVGWPSKLRYLSTERREGLIRAKVLGARNATGRVLVFLDSHCEVNVHWLEPLLFTIVQDPTRVVVPVVDLIDPLTFRYESAMIAKANFDWTLRFRWDYFPWEYFDLPENNVLPFESPIMPGGLLAIVKSHFHEMGEYDMGMDIWGAENVEMSVRMWMCGSSVFVCPCSRVGHVFRRRRPYSNPTRIDTNLHNSLRTVFVWFDDYIEFFYAAVPEAKTIELGEVTERMVLRRKLNCRSFDWYINNINPDLRNSSKKYDRKKLDL